ncbi:phenylacetic acid degradation bifunctional protein PaaZ [Phaeodactylibacter luteus]|uniref:Phenylacetic acid degradation bifunctional protein PaaZ n=1 Tax=Phaeodactylibacter luteus TaxID=1564516 RepID=A0A5C6RF54_9BACT|nr:phenylacetic acid degradation bifunctional protein PaaZ [Phaeodactylibacter luteus]TXB59730.1 phenylacetic acid degradation bifunctional protein PaaZ [Phaeodactylibacter luteus]
MPNTNLHNYILGEWTPHDGDGFPQYDAVTGELIATCSSEGLDYAAIMDYARRVGGPNLRKMTFLERGLMLKKLALHLHGIRKKYYPLSYRTGATKGDSWIDIDGGIGTLFAYASLRRQFPDKPFHVDGEAIGLSKEGTFIGHHIMVPKHGVAVHINAFNFPIWGMLEKVSVNLLAGVPAVVKPSEITSFLTEAIVRDMLASGILPEGALQLVCGKGHGILDTLGPQDVATFTGSAATGRKLKALPNLIEHAVPFNMEADSLNAAILGPDAVPGTPTFDLFIKEVRREMTVKAGQKCTAIRRIIVPENLLEDVQLALSAQLQQTTIGSPIAEGVRMGALVSRDQLGVLRQRIAELARDAEIVYGSPDEVAVIGADAEKGAFCQPVLLLNDDPLNKTAAHHIEAFGPVSTLMPYRELDEAIALANSGKGSLVSTVATADEQVATAYVMGAAAYHGRILILNEESAKESTGHGSPMPMLVHGGPGRAGGGEEMGGVRGVKHYLQRTAIQGHPTMIGAVTGQYQVGGAYKEKVAHPFQQYFEDLEIGETLITARHTVTETDIVNFANVSGDHFYAHVDETSLEGTIFERRVAHGYYLLSKAAGLFVDGRKGPVLLNYGIESFRFTKPVYPGATIGVRFTCKEKTRQEKKEETDVRKGIVKWLVDVYDETGETVAIGTILTMVKTREQ